jgi:ubiquinone/menaquinone biosynthesis C-methylase UbiE
MLPVSQPTQASKPPTSNQPTVPQSLYTEEYFLTACEGYNEFVSSEGEQLSRRLNAAFALAAVEPGMKVLDVGCGRGEILRHCARLGADSFGVDYALVAVKMSRDVIENTTGAAGKTAVGQADAKKLPFPTHSFDRVLMFDVVEHLYPWELHEALLEVYRVLKPDGRFVVHTAPNVWYDRYAYPMVRRLRIWMGKGENYPKNPRAFLVDHNQDVHVNEQSLLSMWRTLNKAGFKSNVWLDSPPQDKYPSEGALLDALRGTMFRVPPFRWFFEREVFAVAQKR